MPDSVEMEDREGEEADSTVKVDNQEQEREYTQEEKDILEYYRLQDEMYNPFDVLASNGGFGEGPKVDKYEPGREYRQPQLFTERPSQRKTQNAISGWRGKNSGGQSAKDLTAVKDADNDDSNKDNIKNKIRQIKKNKKDYLGGVDAGSNFGSEDDDDLYGGFNNAGKD